MAFSNLVGVIGTEIGGALSATASGHHNLFFARQPLKETVKLAPFVEGTQAVCDLTPAHVTAFVATMRIPRPHPKRPTQLVCWGNGTARILQLALRRAFRWAWREGMISKNPLATMYITEGGTRSDDCLITREQHQLLMAQAHPALALLLDALWFTGARPSALIVATAADLAKGHGERIVLENRRGAKKRIVTVYLIPSLRSQLAGREGHLFVNARGEPWSFNAARNAVRRLARRCGLPHVTMYSFRHSFAHRKLAAGAGIAELAVVMSTSVLQIARTYGHLARLDERIASVLTLGD